MIALYANLRRLGSKADVCGAQAHVRFTPNSDSESGLMHSSKK